MLLANTRQNWRTALIVVHPDTRLGLHHDERPFASRT